MFPNSIACAASIIVWSSTWRWAVASSTTMPEQLEPRGPQRACRPIELVVKVERQSCRGPALVRDRSTSRIVADVRLSPGLALYRLGPRAPGGHALSGIVEDEGPWPQATAACPVHPIRHVPAPGQPRGTRRLDMCSVVSSAGGLRDSRCGALIDAPGSTVIRINDPRLRGFEADVGRRKDVMVLNRKLLTMYANKNEPKEKYLPAEKYIWRDGRQRGHMACEVLPKPELNAESCRGRRAGEKANTTIILQQFANYRRNEARRLHSYLRQACLLHKELPAPAMYAMSGELSRQASRFLGLGGSRAASTGFHTFLLAVVLCKRVRLFGFDDAGPAQVGRYRVHYWEDGTASEHRTKAALRSHNLSLEHAFFRGLGERRPDDSTRGWSQAAAPAVVQGPGALTVQFSDCATPALDRDLQALQQAQHAGAHA
mmetsp:Transcript_1924/g.6377  ORF Transcript_1924/g.6377 Transcript_1924/m.6377 type:complete len:429 (+) Transcript_1924:98-1384(+)